MPKAFGNGAAQQQRSVPSEQAIGAGSELNS